MDIIFNKAVYFIATLILARILGPSDFGLVGMIMIFVSIGTTLIDSGLSVSLIRSANPDEIEYSSIFFTNLLLSLVAYFLIYLIAPLVADFYSQPVLKNLIRVYCLSFIINSLRMIPQILLTRQMNFKKIAFLNMPGNIVGIVLGVWMAQNNYEVWSIVGLHLSTQIIATAMFWFFNDWKPVLLFSFSKVKYHWNFGYKLMISAQLNTIFDNIYNILIGKFYSAQSLGYYERAYTLNNYPISILTGIISKVSLPLLSQISDDKERVLRVYRKTLLLSFYFTAPLMLGAVVLAEPLFVLVLGEQWMPAVPFFQILCFAYMLYPIHSLNINVLSVYGRSDLFLRLEIIKKVMVLVLVLIAIQFGIYGLIWSSVVSSIVGLFINTYYTGSLLLYYTRSQLRDIFPTLIHAVLMAVSMISISFLLTSFSSFIQLLIPAISGLLAFVLISFFFKNESFMIILNFIKNRKLYDSSH